MQFTIVYVDDAKLDLRAARKWYKNQRQGLEKLFAKDVQKAILRLKLNPYAFAIRYKTIRIIHPETFPNGIHFYIK